MRKQFVTTREFLDHRDVKVMNSRKQAVGRARKAPQFGEALSAKVELVEYAPVHAPTINVLPGGEREFAGKGEEVEVNRKVIYERDFTAPTAKPANALPPSTIAKKAASYGYGAPVYDSPVAMGHPQ